MADGTDRKIGGITQFSGLSKTRFLALKHAKSLIFSGGSETILVSLMRNSGKTLSAPVSDAEWDLWYQDTFDYECPRQIEVSGIGLLKGLIELWARYLRETVRANGQKGFSRFNLWWKQESRSIEIVGDSRGAVHLKTWIFGERGGNQHLLREVALTHCHLILAGQTSEPILEAAGTVVSRQEFEQQLLSVRNRK